ncbi:MAG: class I SAM-dependent methyltransferase [Holosporaceae bacterium]|jgi:2-polyprenyl-3-methyl-5-hydroxy-6-metoxy-1,4-benzoquinol methylase|nr:class I SAM-dependent methyltransferase [Holosporaceae bacterium]
MNKEEAIKYFKDNAFAWMHNSYQDGGYNYPTPLHRIRVVKEILKGKKIKTVLDIGCGGAQVSIELAKMGYRVTAVDQSKKMLQLAQENISKENQEIQKLITLEECKIDDIEYRNYDCVVAMGLIGYLESDAKLFEVARNSLKSGGVLLVSFRNRLFNLFSITDRTIFEAKNGNLEKLVNEANLYYKNVTSDSIKAFLSALNMISTELLHSLEDKCSSNHDDEVVPYAGAIEPRQTTPFEAKTAAEKFDLYAEKITGVHPHFALSKLNKLFPPGVYNKLCNSLIAFEDQDISLIWSSVFIGCFIKK